MGEQMEPDLTDQPSPVNKKHLVLEADLLEDLFFNDIVLEDVTVSQFDLRRRHVFNDVEHEAFERIPSAISSTLSIPPVG